jgi:hypothetical protein
MSPANFRAICVGITALAIGLGSASAASADDGGIVYTPDPNGPTTQEIVDSCDTTSDDCTWTSVSKGEWLTAPEIVSGMYPNCYQRGTLTMLENWSQTKGTTDSIGASVTISAGNPALSIFSASFTMSYEHTWTESATVTEGLMQVVPYMYLSYVTRQTLMQTVTGHYNTNYPDRWYDHYYWQSADFDIYGPVNPDNTGSVVKGVRVPMDKAQRQTYCGVNW